MLAGRSSKTHRIRLQMLRQSADRLLCYEARQRTEHNQREDTEVKLQHVCLLIPRQAIFGQDSEQFTANGLLRRRVSILTHLERVKSWWRRPKRYSGMSNDDYGCTASTTQQIIKASLQRMSQKVPYIPSRNFNQDGQDSTLASPRVADKANPSAERLQKTPH